MKRDDRFGPGGRGKGDPRGSRRDFLEEDGGPDPFVDDDFNDGLSKDARQERSGSGKSGSASGFDWGAAEEDEPGSDRRVEWEEYREEGASESPVERISQRGRRAPRRARASLLELVTPVLGYCAVLPREAGDQQPAFESFRREIVAALNELESVASQHGIELEDAKLASYALCLLLDEQVAESTWDQKSQWMAGPLTLALHQDPEGGVNFFRRMESLQERQSGVKEVFLVCLALGFRGKYVGLDPAQAAAELGALRQSLLRQIHPVSMDKVRRLFPEAYRAATKLDDQVEPPPRWWLYASGGVVAIAFVLYLILWLWAGAVGSEASEHLATLPEAPVQSSESPARSATVTSPDQAEDAPPDRGPGAVEETP